ncbi:NUDIX hydrolase [Cellulomonas dongxiuzhuiae]|uniref:NUDIX hydrolase n=1 Tax=Cellulomonas dongxiuzhuiae TaxID=2819979 RepID=A0ABX8GLG1_9CELL|nr:NUDIX hydrolase [Cellulomonas dongxiuzhuiae]MBO3089149.1 NUDIX hydrolase [Cellulomonas dongxiuzhuiae]MBO3095071.1 NUDIX hydrolase [Cellulomonas dongxiuzhuiae]QWC16084.1 NUDIX hydrolase [Cellulomonas dongxiuzhuiae]
MAEPPLLLRSDPDPSWLPAGSRADVMLGEPPADEPTGLVRLMVLRGNEFFCMMREPDGRLDIPTRHVAEGEDPHDTAHALASVVLGPDAEVRPWGYVRNFVPTPSNDYPWPSPVACFTVWRPMSGAPVVPGLWCARIELGTRHWWPLAEQAARGPHPDKSGSQSCTNKVVADFQSRRDLDNSGIGNYICISTNRE